MTNYVCIGDTVINLDLIAGFAVEGRKITYCFINTSPSQYNTYLGSEEDAREAFISLKKQICIDTPE